MSYKKNAARAEDAFAFLVSIASIPFLHRSEHTGWVLWYLLYLCRFQVTVPNSPWVRQTQEATTWGVRAPKLARLSSLTHMSYSLILLGFSVFFCYLFSQKWTWVKPPRSKTPVGCFLNCRYQIIGKLPLLIDTVDWILPVDEVLLWKF